MKITQAPTFKPINILLETNQEANDFINLIDKYEHAVCAGKVDLDRSERELLIDISNMFSDSVNLD